MKTFVSAFGGAMMGAVVGGMLVLRAAREGRIPVEATPTRSRPLEDISPRLKADAERRINEADADFRPYQPPRQRAAEIRAMLEELLDGPVTEHEAKQIAQRIGAEIEVLAFDAESNLNDFRPPAYNEDGQS